MLPHHTKIKGFTLFELITVIGIIALLAAIGFPAFSAMMRRMKDTQCMNHLKQWSNAIQSYAADNNNQIYWNPNRTQPFRSERLDDPWASNVGPYTPYFSTNSSRAVALVDKYRKCPSDLRQSALGYAFVRPRYDNGSGGPGARVDPNTTRLFLHSLRKPSSFLLMSDAWNRSPSIFIEAGGGPGGIDIRIKPICEGTEGQPVRHGGKAHVLFADFHIGKHSYEDFQRNENEWMVLQGQTAP